MTSIAFQGGKHIGGHIKVIVAYMSETGNTKKVAEAIFDEIPAEKEMKELSEIESLEGYDLAFVGFPIQMNKAPEPAEGFLQKYCVGKRIALFTTHSAPEEFDGVQGWLEKCKQAAAGAEVLGLFNCQGEMSKEVEEFLLKSDDPNLRAAAQIRPSTIGQPDATRLDRARAFAREIMEKAS